MEFIRIFDYDKLDIPIRDGLRVYEIKNDNKIYGLIFLREFIRSHVVTFKITEVLTEEEFEELFEGVIGLVKGLNSRVLLHFSLFTSPFTDFILKKGGYFIKRSEMILSLSDYVPLPLLIPSHVKFGPFLMGNLREYIHSCFDAIPDYDRVVFAAYSPDDLEKLYTFLYTGREGVFIPEFSLSIYYQGEFAGFIMVNIFSEVYTISEILILKKYQGKGLGKLLLNESLKRMKNRGIPFVQLSVSQKNYRAYHMYEKFGFIKKRDYMVFVYNFS